MHRRYRPWHYAQRIERIREVMPDAAIGADVMVGFPGETEADFEQTRSFIERLPFTYLHVFTYSSRPGTPSVAMAGQIPVQVARERNRVLRDLAASKHKSFVTTFLGRKVNALTLPRQDRAHTEALTDNYLKLMVNGRISANQMITATVSAIEGSTMMGNLCRG
jgi:threonylcarbamoyladenosine tRNA methylthiotransferase MtaB